jgi:tripartite-type tricarboxylate transporter receptor subunit TctC
MMKSILGALLALSLSAPMTANAQTVADFYRGKTMQMVVPFSAGGIYDISTRILARHMPRFIPGQPNMVVQNQPGGGGILAANRLASAVDKDGLTIASVSRGIPQLALVGEPNISFDPAKLTWLGSISSYSDDAYLLTVMANNKVNTVAESQNGALLNLGGVGAGATNTTFAMLARDLLGMKIEVIRGFPGANDVWLAMERGELDGQVIDISAIKSSRPNFWNEKKVKFLVQFGRATRLESMPDVPTGRELVKNADDRALLEFAESPFFMALPYAAPPGVPADRVQALREAFMSATATTDFLTEATKIGLNVSPIDGAAVDKIVEAAAQTAKPIRDRLGTFLLAK